MEFTAQEQHDYVVAVCKKQAGILQNRTVSDEDAAKLADKLSPEQFKTLHDAGRTAKVQVCRDIIQAVL